MISELYNLNFERAVLSALFFDPVLLETTQLKIDDFYLHYFIIIKPIK